MRVRLLGTGSADGWPNAFCGCAACRSAKRLRSPTCALADDIVLFDYGPEAARAALRQAGGLSRVRLLLITGAPPGRTPPTPLRALARARGREPLTVIGPPAMVAAWADAAEPGAPVSFTPVTAGAELTLEGYRIRVLATADDDAVAYDVTGPTGTRLLYAPSAVRPPGAGVPEPAYDLLLLGAAVGAPATPDGLDEFAAQLRALTASGAVSDHSDVVAVQLSHNSPPDLERRLARWGARVVDDGAELVLGDAVARARPTPRRTLVLGGARSGKSVSAERLLQAEPTVSYVATGLAPGAADAEWSARVQLHRDRRPPGWITLETTDVAAAVRSARQPVLVDCLGGWLTALLDDAGAWDDRAGWRARVDEQLDDLLAAWHAAPCAVVAVSNEVGAGVVPASASGRLFRDELGRLNTRLAAASERVLLVVAGREINLSQATP